jgi:acyl-coenzyme A synthetase/AMP-(fatty) acid ligase
MLDVRSALRRAMECNRHRPAVIADGVELTFEGAWKRGCQLANALYDMGLRPGDKVAVLEDNCLEACDFFLASAIGPSSIVSSKLGGCSFTYDQPHRLQSRDRSTGIRTRSRALQRRD